MNKFSIDLRTNTLNLDGVDFSFEFLKQFVNPTTDSLYAIKRNGNEVTITEYRGITK